MPRRRVKVSQFNYGIKSTPASSKGGWLGASTMENLRIDENGYLQAAGATERDSAPISGSGTYLNILHYAGVPRTSLPPVTRSYRDSNRAVSIGRRAFYTSLEGNPTWKDLTSNAEYDWEMNAPVTPLRIDKSNRLPITDEGAVYDIISNVEIRPNPFLDRGNIQFQLLQDADLRITIWDIQGRLIAHLDNGTVGSDNFFSYSAGTHTVQWDGENDARDVVPTALYFVSIEVQHGGENILIASTRAGFFGVSTQDLAAREEMGEDIPESGLTPQEEFADGGELRAGVGLRGGNYLVCYTYANDELGMETPPSTISEFRVIAFQVSYNSTPDSYNRAPYALVFSGYQNELPAWANQVKFYVKRGYIPRDISKVRDTPYLLDFAYVGGPGREDLADSVAATYQWANERVDPSRQRLTFTQENAPVIADLAHLTAYSARLWAWDRRTHAVRFSLIDGAGVSRYDIFPMEDTPIPHAVRFEGEWRQCYCGSCDAWPGRVVCILRGCHPHY